MPKYGLEDIVETPGKSKLACSGVKDDLLECLLKSDCVKKNGKTPRECLMVDNEPGECKGLRVAFFECKRSLLDMRQRFRGRKGY